MNKKNVGILLAILVLPFSIALVLKLGKTEVLPLPYYGPEQISGNDTLPYKVDISRLFGEDKWPNEHLLLHFVPLEETELYKHAIGNLKKIEERLGEVDNITMVSALNQDARKDVPVTEHWITSDAVSNELNWIEKDLLPGFEKSTNYADDQVLVLVDKERHVRGFYFAGSDKLSKDLLGELVVLRINYAEH